jgi:hypothetical protein
MLGLQGGRSQVTFALRPAARRPPSSDLAVIRHVPCTSCHANFGEGSEMERNDRVGSVGDTSGAGQGSVKGSTGAGGFGGTSDVGGSAGGFGASGTGDVGGAGSLGERAKNVAGTAQDKLSDVGSTVRERAGQAKNSLADALEAGADRLRTRSGQQLAGATSYGEGSVSTESGRMTEIGQRVAGGLQSSADWLREADIDGLRQGVERQVRENPGRTLLIAVGLGYLLGKAFRR